MIRLDCVKGEIDLSYFYQSQPETVRRFGKFHYADRNFAWNTLQNSIYMNVNSQIGVHQWILRLRGK